MYSLSRRRLLETPKVFGLALLFTLASGTLFYFMFSFEFYRLPALFDSRAKETKIYLLHSKENERFLVDAKYDIDAHGKQLLQLQQLLASMGFRSELVYIDELPFLQKGAVVIAADLFALSPQRFEDIKRFVREGGRLFFNYHFGFFTPEGDFVGPKRIGELTSLEYIDHLEHNASEGSFIVPRTLSVLGAAKGEPRRSDLIRYDPIPLFRSADLPDALLTNWQVTLPPKLGEKLLETREAGVMWHGRYGKGAWCYASFPLYSFLEMQKQQKERYLKTPLELLRHESAAVLYPFLHLKNVVFVSEDTEYKYPQLLRFARLAGEFGIPSTLFCVASLAQKYPDITKEAAALAGIEIASHSYSHTSLEEVDDAGLVRETAYAKEILEQISGQEVIGFRPPKEEIDKRAKEAIIEAGYRYVMERTRPHLLPFLDDELVIIPRHGTDDYNYLVNLDWDQEEILRQILRENAFLNDLGALFTLSVHTHLLTYDTNIEVLRRYFAYLKSRKEITPLNGRQLETIARKKSKISIEVQRNPKSLVVTLRNGNSEPVDRVRFRLYHLGEKRIERVYSEIINIKARIIEEGKDYVDVEVERLYPEAALSLILPLGSG